MAALNDIYRRTITKIDENDCIKFSVSVIEGNGRGTSKIISQLRWFSKDRPTTRGITLNSNMLSLLWKNNADIYSNDKWLEESIDEKISVSFNRLDTVQITTFMNNKSGEITLNNKQFRKFIEHIPCMELIMTVWCTETKVAVARKVLTVMMTKNLDETKHQRLTEKYLRNQRINQGAELHVAEITLNLPHSMMIQVLKSKNFIDMCSKELTSGAYSRTINKMRVLPLFENEMNL